MGESLKLSPSSKRAKNIDSNSIPQRGSDFFTKGLCANAEDIANAETIALIDDYLEYNTVGILYGDSGSGKSMLTLSICVYLLEFGEIEQVHYYDFDNGRADHKNRGIDKLITKYAGRFNYITLDTLDDHDLTPPMVINGLIDSQQKGDKPYEKQFFIFDTMGELAEGSLSKDEVMRPLLDKFKKLRSMGATIQLIHHTTKSKEDVSFFGSNYIKIKIDALWYLLAKDTMTKDEMEFALKCDKNRSGNLKDTAFTINPTTHTLKGGDYAIASMSDKDTEFVLSVKKILSQQVFINQTELLKEMGKQPNDNTAVKRLKKYSGKFWKSEKIASKNNSVMYSLLEDT